MHHDQTMIRVSDHAGFWIQQWIQLRGTYVHPKFVVDPTVDPTVKMDPTPDPTMIFQNPTVDPTDVGSTVLDPAAAPFELTRPSASSYARALSTGERRLLGASDELSNGVSRCRHPEILSPPRDVTARFWLSRPRQISSWSLKVL